MNTPQDVKVQNLLIVEDDPILRRFYKQSLKGYCGQLTLVDTSEKALEELKNCFYEFLITDLKLDSRNGLDVVQFAVERCSTIKILVASGYATDEAYHKQLGGTPNVKGFLQKPFTIEDLHSKLDTILGS
jgi:DNA-binding NtrC family response regulator